MGKFGTVCAALAGFAAIAVVLPMAASANQIGFSLIESDSGGSETLTTDLAGAVITGTADNWRINVGAAGVTLDSNSPDLPLVYKEAMGETGYNWIKNLGGNVLGLTSEVNDAGISHDYCGTSSPLSLGTTCYVGYGSGNNYYVTVREPEPSVPEPASMALFGTALFGIGLVRRRRRQHA